MHCDIHCPVGSLEACCTTVMLKDTGSNLTMCCFSSDLQDGSHVHCCVSRQTLTDNELAAAVVAMRSLSRTHQRKDGSMVLV